jgi:hypothetical protein
VDHTEELSDVPENPWLNTRDIPAAGFVVVGPWAAAGDTKVATKIGASASRAMARRITEIDPMEEIWKRMFTKSRQLESTPTAESTWGSAYALRKSYATLVNRLFRPRCPSLRRRN